MIRSALLVSLALAAVTAQAQTVLRFQAVGTGAGRAASGAVIASSWVGMGLQSPVVSNGALRVSSGMPALLVGTPVAHETGAAAVIDVLLGRVPIQSISLHIRGALDCNGDGRLDVADLVCQVNQP
jgi:hypothetical protein